MAGDPDLLGIPVNTWEDKRRLSFKIWCMRFSVAPKSMEAESDNALALRRRHHFEHAERVLQAILSRLDPCMRYFSRDVGPASELWLHGLENMDHALEIWSNFTRLQYGLQYDLGESPSDIKNFCAKYQETVELCKGADIVLDTKIQSFQFMENLEEYFPEWYRGKKDIILKYTRTISEESQIPEFEDLMKVVVILETQSIFVLTDDVSRRPKQ